jgi:glycerophosphoryl diester phosphodiesterase
VAVSQQKRPALDHTLHALDARSPEGLRELFRYTGESLPLVSAHRGGAIANHPENCLATFENTLRQTFAIMEVDPRYTRDGQIVIHHDPTLDRTTTGSGRVVDHDLADLRKLRLKDPSGKATDYQIPTLDEALTWARGKTILVLDQKDVPVKARVKKIEEHQAEAYAMLIVYSFEGARQCYDLNKNVMMEVMITDRKQFEAFDKTGVPWSNIVAFVGHNPPRDRELLAMIHAKGALCLAGTSRNLDRQLAALGDQPREPIAAQYRALLKQGVDFVEADLAGKVGRLLYTDAALPQSSAKFFLRPGSP